MPSLLCYSIITSLSLPPIESLRSSLLQKISKAAERIIGGHEAKGDQEAQKFLHIAQDINKKVPGLEETVWGQKGMGPQYPTLDKDLNVDVVVIGAGIAGLSIAYNLVKAGKKVAVLEGKSRGKACDLTVVASTHVNRNQLAAMFWDAHSTWLEASNWRFLLDATSCFCHWSIC
jgi:hypothetical protein